MQRALFSGGLCDFLLVVLTLSCETKRNFLVLIPVEDTVLIYMYKI